MIAIRNLEIHLTHACNLACESCSHYSNQGHKGMLSLDEAHAWMQPWSRRLAPHTFSLLGGEPTIHPDLCNFLTLARRSWPDAHLRLVTNGFFLHRHPALPQMLRDDPNACLYLSVHHNSPEYQEKITPILLLVQSWVDRYRIRVMYYDSFRHWTRTYHGSGAAMEPFADGNPRSSWEHCRARYCPQLFEGKIWKCGPLAYLKLQQEKYGLSESWKPYLAYKPLEPGCSDAEAAGFFAREEESHCGMCAAKPQHLALPIPIALPRRAAAAPLDP